MARPKKCTVDYFPHVIKDGRSLFILESRWGNDGYTFLFKLMEMLCQSDNMVLDAGNPVTMEFLAAKTRITTETAGLMLEKLALIGKIDAELWKSGVIWCQDLVDSVKDAYRKRIDQFPEKPVVSAGNSVYSAGNSVKTENSGISGDGNGEIILKESKLNKNKEKSNPPKSPLRTADNDIALKELVDSGFPIQDLAPEAKADAMLDLFRRRYSELTGKEYAIDKWDMKNLTEACFLNSIELLQQRMDEYFELFRRKIIRKPRIGQWLDNISDRFERLMPKKSNAQLTYEASQMELDPKGGSNGDEKDSGSDVVDDWFSKSRIKNITPGEQPGVSGNTGINSR